MSSYLVRLRIVTALCKLRIYVRHLRDYKAERITLKSQQNQASTEQRYILP